MKAAVGPRSGRVTRPGRIYQETRNNGRDRRSSRGGTRQSRNHDAIRCRVSEHRGARQECPRGSSTFDNWMAELPAGGPRIPADSVRRDGNRRCRNLPRGEPVTAEVAARDVYESKRFAMSVIAPGRQRCVTHSTAESAWCIRTQTPNSDRATLTAGSMLKSVGRARVPRSEIPLNSQPKREPGACQYVP